MVTIVEHMHAGVEAALPRLTGRRVRLITLRVTVLLLSLKYLIKCLLLSCSSLRVCFLGRLHLYGFTAQIVPILRCCQLVPRELIVVKHATLMQ